jgi:hypothetical protein
MEIPRRTARRRQLTASSISAAQLINYGHRHVPRTGVEILELRASLYNGVWPVWLNPQVSR